jgi:hypothetical protein
MDLEDRSRMAHSESADVFDAAPGKHFDQWLT